MSHQDDPARAGGGELGVTGPVESENPDPAGRDLGRESPSDAGGPPRRRAPWVAAGVVAGLAALGYLGTAWWSGEQVPEGTMVAGVDLGGLSRSEATAALRERVPGLLADPAEVRLGETVAQLVPQDAGLGVDVAATVRPLTGFSLDPRVVLARVVGGSEEELVTRVEDEDALESSMAALAEQYDTSPVDGAITLVDGAAEVSEPRDGVSVQEEDAAQAFADAWPADGPIDLPVDAQAPRVDQEDVDTAMHEIVDPLIAAPVIVEVEEARVELTPADLTAVSTLTSDEDGTLSLAMNADDLRERVVDKAPELRGDAQDARIEIQGGAPTIVPSSTGTGLDPAQLEEEVRAAAQTPDERTVRLELTEIEPDLTTQEAQQLGVDEPIAEFATNLTSDRVRTHNLVVGSEKITDTLVLPGEEFSLLAELGPITRENGFGASGVITSGFTDEAVGGGLSQLSTNTYNAGFLAGMVDIEHKPHSRYYARYPAGREATLWDPDIDMIWQNDTPYGVLVEAWVSGGRQHVRLWSTPYWEVRESTSGRYNHVPPQTRVNTAADCEPEGPGPAGFTIDIFRERHRDGELVDEQSWRWTYNPWHRVVCE